MKKNRIIMLIITLLLVGFSARFVMLGEQSQKMKPNIGIENGQLKKCPSKPNCITSFYEEDKDHYYRALTTNLSIDEIKSKITQSELKWKLVKEENDYLYYTFESSLIKFVDDIEILIDGNKIHFRSASRVGYSDLGANKKRIIQFEKLLK